MEEEWRDVVGYEGLYKVSNFGKIKSLPRRGTSKIEKIKALVPNTDGYLLVRLYKHGKEKGVAIQRLVAEAFIDNTYNKKEVNHIDGDKTNNAVSNLEWVTHRENMIHARNNNLISISERVIKQGHNIGKKYGKTNGTKRRKKVNQYKENMEFIRQYKSLTEASYVTGITIANISKCCNGHMKKVRGYIWKFAN